MRFVGTLFVTLVLSCLACWCWVLIGCWLLLFWKFIVIGVYIVCYFRLVFAWFACDSCCGVWLMLVLICGCLL